MKPLLKAVLLSAAVFLVVVLGIFFVSSTEEKISRDGAPERADVTAPPAGNESETETPTLTAVPRGDRVKLTVEVLAQGKGRRLPGSRVLVSRLTATPRDGEQLYDSRSHSKKTTGLFEIDLPPGAYNVRVSCLRYQGESRSVTLLADTPQRVAFELGRGNSISGKILSRSGGTIAGARVLALEELVSPDADMEEALFKLMDLPTVTGQFAAEDISAEDGSYQLDGLEFKTYTIRAVAAGYTPNAVEEVPAPRAEVNVLLAQGGAVTGVVQDDSGLGVEGATVSAFQPVESQNVFKIISGKTRPPVDTADTDSAGRFQFDTLGPGLYNFRIQAKGYQTSEELKKRTSEGTPLSFIVKRGLALHGFVTGPDGEPVPGARVRATASGARAARGADQINIQFKDESLETDERGEFVFDTLGEAAYTVLCWHAEADYASLRHKDVHVRPGMDPLQLKLDRGGQLRGKVLDAYSGNPIAGARISTNDIAELRKDDFSKGDGSYLVTGLAPNRPSMLINVNAPGYSSESRNVQIPKTEAAEETFELTPSGIVSGRVVNSAGDPVAGARVMAKTEEVSSPTLSMGMTDDDGTFSLEGVRPGENRWIRVKKSQYLEGHSEAFNLEPAQTLEIGSIKLELGAALTGTVVGLDGKGVPECRVSIAFEGEAEGGYGGNPSGHTNSRGEFTIGGLESGTVSLVVKASHFIEKRVDQIKVVQGKQFTLNPIHLEQGSSLSGTVVDTHGKPVANAEVIVLDYSVGVKELRTVSSTDGSFNVENILSSDVVEITVSHKNFAFYSNERVPATASDLEIVLKEHGRLRGVVVDADGNPVASFAVAPQEPADSRNSRKKVKPQTFSPPDGAFEYTGLPGGVYTITIRAASHAAVTLENVTVEEGQSLDLGRITLLTGGIVSGTVIDSKSGVALAGASVQIVQGSGRFMRDADAAAEDYAPHREADKNGNFFFSRLTGGALTLRVSHPGYVTRKVPKVDPDSAQSAQNISVQLDQSGEISGVVLDAEGKPKVSMSVFLMGAKRGGNQRTQTDRQGRFLFSSVGAGTFSVKAHKFGSSGRANEHAELDVQMGPGQKKDVELQLE